MRKILNVIVFFFMILFFIPFMIGLFIFGSIEDYLYPMSDEEKDRYEKGYWKFEP